MFLCLQHFAVRGRADDYADGDMAVVILVQLAGCDPPSLVKDDNVMTCRYCTRWQATP
jgi:hypothetical protein